MTRQRQTENLTDSKFYIDKTGELEKALTEYSCVYLEGAAASGKSTAVRMLCQRQKEISILTVSAQKETLEEYSVRIDAFRKENPQVESGKSWIIVEDFPGRPTEEETDFFLSLIARLRSGERMIFEAREELPEAFLNLLWKGKLQLLPQEILRLSRKEIVQLAGERNSFLNPSEVYDKTGGWAGCADLLFRLTSRTSCRMGMWNSVAEVLQRHEVRTYLEKEIIQTLQPEEKELLQCMETCPWLEPELCRDVFQIPDAVRALDSLRRKGLLTRCCRDRLWKRIPLFESFSEGPGAVQEQKLRKSGEWFEQNGFPEQALYCLKEAGDREGYRKCLRIYYEELPFSGIELSEEVLLEDSSPESCYLRGMQAVQKHDWTVLEKEIHLIEKQKTFQLSKRHNSENCVPDDPEENRKAVEIWLNLTFADPLISLDDWMKNLKQAAKDYGSLRLYHILGGSCTYLSGLRELSGLFVGGKAAEKKRAELWKSSLGPEEWKKYQLARVEFYMETRQQGKLPEEDWKLLLSMDTGEPWQMLLARYWLLIKIRRSNLSEETEDVEKAVRSALGEEENEICCNTLEAMDALRRSTGGEKILFSWLKDRKAEWYDEIREDNAGMWYLRAAACYEIQQYDRTERILKKLISFARSGRRSRILAECLFQQAAVNWCKGNKKKALQDVIESFLVTGEFRYFRFYTRCGRNGYEVLEDYMSWLSSNTSDAWSRKKKYNYGNVLNMPLEDYMNTILREAKKKKGQTARKSSGDTEEALTVTEIIVLKELSSGRTNEEICADLNLKLTTVKGHIYSIYKKLGVKTRVQALLTGKERGLIREE